MLVKSYITTQLIQIIHSNEIRNTIHTHENRRIFFFQQSYFTYQRKGNQELEVQLLNSSIADLQNTNINLTLSLMNLIGGGGGVPDQPIIGII